MLPTLRCTSLATSSARTRTNFIMLECILACRDAIEELISRQDFKEWLKKNKNKETGDCVVATIKSGAWLQKSS